MFTQNSHPSAELLRKAIDGQLAPPQSAAVERHVVDCDACRRLMEQQPATGRPDPAAASRVSALRSRLRDGIVSLSTENGEVAPEPRHHAAAALAILAVAALALAVGAPPRPLDGSSRALLPGLGEQSALPDAGITPGAVHRMTAAELCAGHRPLERSVPSLVRLAVLRDYDMETVPAQEYELDYLITPELGGVATRQNLWPERYASRRWNARVKDQLETLLPQLVCEGSLELAVAQRDIASNWIAAYQRYFHTNQPLATPSAALDDDDVVVHTARPLVALAQLAWRER